MASKNKHYCTIKNCPFEVGTANKNIAMFKAGEGDRQQWISSIQQYQQIENQSPMMICEFHFDLEQITKRKDRNILEKGARPTIFPNSPLFMMRESKGRTKNVENTNELTKTILNLEIQVVKLRERNILLDKKLTEKANSLQNTRKELTRCKNELAKLKLETGKLPIVQSELLNDPSKRRIIECLLNGIDKREKYCEAVRLFAINLSFLSTRGYSYFREKFNNHLPHPATIRKWFATSNENCVGFHSSALSALSEIVEELEANGKKMYVALSFDEMAIRQHIQYLPYKKKFCGFINFGTTCNKEDALPVAKNAIVVMLNAINMQLTLPIASFFITTLIAEEKAVLIATILKTLTNLGIRVVSITSDGLSSNLATYDILGASADDHQGISPYFRNPDTDEKVYVIYDVPHMLKLVRNCLGDKHILRDEFNRAIDWKFIERLYRTKTNDLVSHKLTKKHIKYEGNVMNVTLATQTISNSVAETIEKLASKGFRTFKDSEGTVEFLKKFNTGFDVFNCDKEIENNFHKSPINSSTKQTIFTFLDEFIEYIRNLKLNGKPITTTGRKVPFIGFINNSIALKMMYEEFVETGIIGKIQTTDLQQDLLESFFGRMRSKGGNNSNPTQQQFIGNFRRILVNKELTSSSLSNCVDRLQILHVPSTKSSQASQVDVGSDFDFIMQISGQDDEISQHDANDSDDHSDSDNYSESDTSDSENVQKKQSDKSARIREAEVLGIVNLAGSIEVSIFRSKKMSCNECSNIFELNDKIDPVLFVKNKKNVLPCKSTYEICEIGRDIMSDYFTSVHMSHFNFEILCNKIKSAIDFNHSFVGTNVEQCEHGDEHRVAIINSLIEEMIRMRCVAIARTVTMDQHKLYVRSSKTHDIHFAGQ